MKCWKYDCPHGFIIFDTEQEAKDFLESDVEGMEPWEGKKWRDGSSITEIEMTQEERDKLPEWGGW